MANRSSSGLTDAGAATDADAARNRRNLETLDHAHAAQTDALALRLP